MWKIIPVFLLLELCCAGCFTRPVENYRNLADFKKNFPKLDIAELSKKKVLTPSRRTENGDCEQS